MVLPLLLLVASVVAASVDAEIPRACVGEHQKLQFCNTSLPVSARVEDLLARLPLDEKAILLTARASPRGNMSSIGLPEYNWGANCVHGVRSTCGTNCPTSFPNPVNLSIHRRCVIWRRLWAGNFADCGSREQERTTRRGRTLAWTADHPTLISAVTRVGDATQRRRRKTHS